MGNARSTREGAVAFVPATAASSRTDGKAQAARSHLARKQRLDTFAIADTIPVAIWVSTPGGELTYVNRRLCQFVGRNSEDLLASRWAEYVHPNDRARCLARWHDSVRTGAHYEVEARCLRHDGEYRWILVRAEAQRDARSQRILRWVGSAVDVTERKEADQVLRQSKKDLERLVAQRTQSLLEMTDQLNAFVHSVAHELRAPLRSQLGLARALLEDYGPKLRATGGDYARRIVQSAERQRDILEGLLAHVSVSRSDLRLEPVGIAEVIEQARIDLALEARDRRAVIDAADVGPSRVLANRTSLYLVVLNLLSNALKFVAPEVKPRVRLRTERREDMVRLWVEDNGIGIDARHLRKLFSLFQRLPGSDRYDGTGIGLAIVRKAAERMRGHVGVESEPGKGSRFWVELKAANSVRN